MGTPLGDFLRAKRDTTAPETVGLRTHDRRRVPGLRRSDLASRADVSVEYLTRIEQGRDRNPSPAVLQALADGLRLDAAEREHLRYLAKITGGACVGQRAPVPPTRDVRPAVLETLRLLEPAVAVVTNRLGDVLASTDGFEAVWRDTGLLDVAEPNLTRYVFTDARSRHVFLDWDRVADEQAFHLWLAPSVATSEWFRAELAPMAGPEFTRRIGQHIPPRPTPLRISHPVAGELRWHREQLDLPEVDAQQIVVYLPADDATSQGLRLLFSRRGGRLRVAT